MKAIVLTYDKYRALTEHMIVKYEVIWPNHPFQFLIPYQYLKGEDTSKSKYIKCPADIKSTVLTLLQDLDDDEWIYWCIDDKYPIFLDLPGIESVMDWVMQSSECSSVLFCRCRDNLNGDALRKEQSKDSVGNIYLRRKNYEQIWLHQFLRVKIIRHLFESFPDTLETAKSMDKLKGKMTLPESHHLFVTKKNLAVFGESTSRGKLTFNCYQSILENNLTLPEIPLDKDNNTIMGTRLDFSNPLEKVKSSLSDLMNRLFK